MVRLLALALACLLGADVGAAQSDAPGAPGARAGRSGGGAARVEMAETDAPAEGRSAAEHASAATNAPIYYVVRERPQVFSRPDSSLALDRLDFREDVRVIEQREDGWSRVLTDETVGWVATKALSNVWILIDKESRYLYVYRGTELVRKLPADVSQNPNGDKVRRSVLGESDHYRIPEGVFFITSKNTQSQYYRSLMLNYPNEEHAERGLREGIITRAEYQQIVSASRNFRSPPMGTRLGGAIAIHGQGSGRQRAWTRGCLALRDVHLDAIWDLVEVGTPVLVQ